MDNKKRLRIHGKPPFPKPPGEKSAPITPSAILLFFLQSKAAALIYIQKPLLIV